MQPLPQTSCRRCSVHRSGSVELEWMNTSTTSYIHSIHPQDRNPFSCSCTRRVYVLHDTLSCMRVRGITIKECRRFKLQPVGSVARTRERINTFRRSNEPDTPFTHWCIVSRMAVRAALAWLQSSLHCSGRDCCSRCGSALSNPERSGVGALLPSVCCMCCFQCNGS